LSLLRDEPVWGLLVGDGSALAEHRRRAEALGVSNRLVTPGRVPFDEVPLYVSALDVCVSTQSNDAVGQSRTTAKLPEYLACDRHVLATAVGGALDALPSSMLLPYAGAFDAEHPKRLAERLASLVTCRAELRAGAGTRAIALARYDYDMLAARLAELIEAVVAR
jgi:glycosyltransferase involved in cell wall biosynthesis